MLTQQEMFDRAWNGLKGQNWQKSTFRYGGGCSYDGPNGLRCAWGHVDPEGTKNRPDGEQLSGTVGTLKWSGIGLAAQLSDNELAFAQDLQRAHDRSQGAQDMEQRMRYVATQYGLTIPGE